MVSSSPRLVAFTEKCSHVQTPVISQLPLPSSCFNRPPPQTATMLFKAIWQQYFPFGSPPFIEADLAPSSQVGKVFIITGANSGIGKELTRFLYPTGATIYLPAGLRKESAKPFQRSSLQHPPRVPGEFSNHSTGLISAIFEP